MAETAIEWTQRTWNPIVGCSLASPGCTNCYAMRMARRIELMGTVAHYAGLTQETKAGPVWTGKLAPAPEHVLLEPLRRRKPTTWFVNSMGDLFHESVPDEWIDRVFAVMALCPQHTFQVLTKRAARMRVYLETLSAHAARDAANELPARWQLRLSEANPPGSLSITKADVQWALGIGAKMSIDPPTPVWPLPNVWLGVSAEDQKRADDRIPDLLATPAAVRFVSAEPLLGPIDFNRIPRQPDEEDRIMPGFSNVEAFIVSALHGQRGLRMKDCTFWGEAKSPTLDWIIVGGESGPGARPMHPVWARSIRDQCAAAGTAFFFKQWGEWAPGDAFGMTQDGPVTDRHGNVREWMRRYVECGDERADRLTAHSFTAHATNLVYRVSKKRAGRLLDGVKHNAMPEVRR